MFINLVILHVRMGIIKNLLFISLPVLIIVIAISEFLLRWFFPVADPYDRFKHKYEISHIPSALPPHLKYRFTSNEQLPFIDSAMNFSTNNVGFRGDSLAIPKPDDELRIFIVGGSTAQCLHIDDSKSLNSIVQRSLSEKFPGRNVKVYTAARSGDGTSEHLAMLTQRIIQMQPDLIIVFAGFNDLRKSVQKYDYMHLRPQQQSGPRTIYQAVTDLQVGRRMYYLFKRTSDDELRKIIPLSTNYRELFTMQQRTPESDSLPYINAEPYAINLSAIAGACKANKIPLVFVPNQSTWNSTSMKMQHWLLTCGKVRYREDYLEKGLRIFNDTMKAVASRNNIALFDLPARMAGTGDFFYDDCHFNNNGALEAGKMLGIFVGKNLQIAGPETK